MIFRNCHVLFARNWPLGVHVSDGGTIGPVLFDGITIRYPRSAIVPHMGRQSVRIDIVKDVWAKDDRRGRINKITFRNVAMTGENIPPIMIHGHDDEHCVSDVTFAGLKVNGSEVAAPDNPIFKCNRFVRNLKVLPLTGQGTGR